MKKTLVGMLVAVVLLAPTSTFAQTSANAELQGRYESLLRQLISLLTQRIAALQLELDERRAQENGDDAREERDQDTDEESEDEDTRRTDEDDAEDAIEDAEDAIADAEEEIDEADEDGADVDDAEDLLEEAEAVLDEARDAFDDEDWEEATERAEEAEELAAEAVDEIDSRTSDDEDDEDEDEAAEGSVSVSTIPLLVGGTILPGDTKPIAYVQVKNTGDSAVEVEGFWVKQNGSADAGAIATLSTVDDKGGNRNTSDQNPFSGGKGFAPSGATIEAGAMKLFTIKAELPAGASVSGTYKLDVTDIEVDAEVDGSLPLKGVTWTVGG